MDNSVDFVDIFLYLIKFLGIGIILYIYQNLLHKINFYYRCTCFLNLLRYQLLNLLFLDLANLFFYIPQENSLINYVSELK